MAEVLRGSLMALMLVALFCSIPVGGYLIAAHFLRREKARQKERSDKLSAFARQVGWKYSPSAEVALSHLGDSVYPNAAVKASNIFEGVFRNQPVRVFEVSEAEFFACFQLDHQESFPFVDIKPQRAIDEQSQKAIELLKNLLPASSFAYVEFEGDPLSEDFSRTFRVISDDEEVARAICVTHMMEYLLRHRDFGVNIFGHKVTLYRPRMEWTRVTATILGQKVLTDEHPVLKPEGIEPRLIQLMEVCDLLPPDLPDMLSAQAAVRAEADKAEQERLEDIEEPPARKSLVSAGALVAANLIPLLGVLFAGWKVFEILILFWMENVVVGALNVAKIACLEGESPSKVRKLVPLFWQKVFAIPFFIIHYGGFVAVHGLFLFAFLRGAFGGSSGSIDWTWLQIPLIGLIVSHGISFYINYIGRGEFRRATIKMQMNRPYGRIVVMHLTIVLGGFVVAGSGNPIWLVILLIFLKIGVDLYAHFAERQKYSKSVKK